MKGTTRGLQIAFIILMLVCAVQTTWWIYDALDFAIDRRDGVTFDDADFAQRRRQYLAEGGFFIAALGASMFVLYRALSQRAELRRRQENFLAAVSHELKSPLASIQLAAETLQMRADLKEPHATHLNRILEDAQRLEDMISNILGTSRIDTKLEGGIVPRTPEPVRLSTLIGAVVADLAPRYQHHGVVFRNDVANDCVVNVDPLSARTVTHNLLDNAAKAVQAAKGGTVSVTHIVNGDTVQLFIHDDGVGFAPDEAARLFDKFYRTGNELRRTQPGSGLGLYIVKRLVELDDGTVSATSEGDDQGATFRVTWPVSGDSP